MSRAFAVTSGAPRQRCMKRGCGKWEFAKGLCNVCSKEGGLLVQLADQDWEKCRNKAPIATKLVVVRICTESYFMELAEGEYVDVIEWMTQHGVAMIRTAREQIGYYALDAMKTEQQIYEEFMIEEDYELVMELDQKEEKERQREAAFEQNLKNEMKRKAEADRIARENESRQRKERAEQMLHQLEMERAAEDASKREADISRRRDMAQKEQMRNVQQQQLRRDAGAIREADERAFKARMNEKESAAIVWEQQEIERKDREYLASLPAWKRDVILRKRQQGQ